MHDNAYKDFISNLVQLSEYKEPVTREFPGPTAGNPPAMKEHVGRNNKKTKEATHFDASKPRTRSMKKPDTTYEDTTALLDKQETNAKLERYQKIMKANSPLENKKVPIETTSKGICDNENVCLTEEDKLFVVNETVVSKQSRKKQDSNDIMISAKKVEVCQAEVKNRSGNHDRKYVTSTKKINKTMGENKEISQAKIEQDVEENERDKLLSCNGELRINNSDNPKESSEIVKVNPEHASFGINNKIGEESKGAKVMISVCDDPIAKDNEDKEDTPLV